MNVSLNSLVFATISWNYLADLSQLAIAEDASISAGRLRWQHRTELNGDKMQSRVYAPPNKNNMTRVKG